MIQNKINFDLNSKDLTAVIKDAEIQKSDVLVPRVASKTYIITKIGDYSFCYKTIIRNISFEDNSEIHTFGQSAFSGTSIKYISIPSRVERIECDCFSECKELRVVDIPEDSNLVYLGEHVFFDTLIENLFITAKLSKIPITLFFQTPKLINITISPKNIFFLYYKNDMIIGKNKIDDKEYTNLLFARRNIEKIIIPSFITYIASYAFNFCTNLKSVDFENGSNLNCVSKDAFDNSSLTNISFPRSLQRLYLSLLHTFKTIEFLGDSFFFNFQPCFNSNLLLISFPNCNNVSIIYNYYVNIQIFTCANAHIEAREILVWPE